MKPQLSIVDGNLFDAAEPILIHQVNCRGVMGAGTAAELLRRYPNGAINYQHVCNIDPDHPEDLLGSIISDKLDRQDGPTQTIFHCFAQDNYGRNHRHTDYDALHRSLSSVEQWVREQWCIHNRATTRHTPIAAPYMMGCGLAGGSWRVVEAIFHDVFIDSPVPLTFYRFNPKQP